MNSSDANNTLIDEMMQLLIAEKEKAFPTILAKLYNQAMIVERETHLGAGSYERSEGRDGYANGFKPRNYQTFHGNLELQVPQVRGSSTKFYPKCLDRGSRSERAIALAAAQMYLQGVSTRRVETVFHCMGIEQYSAEQVSNAAKTLDEELGKWRKRRLGCIKVLFVDATYQKVRVDGAAMDLATFIVTGVSEDGHRSIIAVFSLPEPMRKKLRTNNLEERLNRSIKARTRLISVLPNQASQLRLVSAICMEISDEWEAGMIYLNVKEL